jgi:death-on-curing protein
VTEPVWLRRDVILAVHDEQLAEHGGAHGLRDGGLLDSALARPQHLLSYGDPDVSELAAAYGWGIARNHPFVDGNKRTALVAAELFLVLNGYELQADDADCVVTMLKVAAREMAEDDFAAWIRGHIQRRG